MEYEDQDEFNHPASIGQINMLRDEFIKAKDIFDFELESLREHFSAELEARDRKIKILQTRNHNLQIRVANIENDVVKLKLLIDDLEQYSRRPSLRITGIPITKNETPMTSLMR